MLMVDADQARVERDLLSGSLKCPGCAGQLRPWGSGRKRKLRKGQQDIEMTPRRARCCDCRTTHVLLPEVCLLRRRDLAEVIGQALLRRAAGKGQRSTSRLLEVPLSTVRGWIGCFAERCELIRGHFTRFAVSLGATVGDLLPESGRFADAMAAIGCAHRAATDRFGPCDLWPFVSFTTGGLLLNTSTHLPTVM